MHNPNSLYNRIANWALFDQPLWGFVSEIFAIAFIIAIVIGSCAEAKVI